MPISNALPSIPGSDYPWDMHVNSSRSSPESGFNHGDNRLHTLCREACPLFDRLGRALSDMSTQMWNYIEPGSIRYNQINRPVDPLGSFESRIMSLLRERYDLQQYRLLPNFQNLHILS